MARPMLGDLDLEQVQLIETDEDQVVTHHPVVALDGGFVQPMGRRAARLRLVGVLTAPPTLESLAELRARFVDAAPVPFVSDISTATAVNQVLIEAMDVREVAGTPDRLEYRFVLREYLEAEPIETEPIDVPPGEIPDVEHGALDVTVIVEGDPNFDFDRVQVTVTGTPDDGPPLNRNLTNRSSDNVWFEADFPAGRYTVQALVDDNRTPTGVRETLTGSAQTRVENGEVASVLIVLRREGNVCVFLGVHFRFDNAFVEPCMRPILQDAARYAADHPDQRLLIAGHTDLVGSAAYNQSLSERRARSVYALMTFGVDRQAAIEEWNELRRARPVGVLPSSRDTWGTREYQWILRDLGYFNGNIGADLDLTDAAVRRFQTDNGLTADGIVGDDTWPALIEQYLAQDALAISPDRFLPNANPAGCDEGPLRWLGCNEQKPVRNVTFAWRPNRRTDLMFVSDPAIPCQVLRPETLDLVPNGAGGGGWCLDDGTATTVDCFLAPADTACTARPDKWCRRPVDPATIRVTGRVQFSDGSPVANSRYILTAPDGQYLDGEIQETNGSERAGTPVPGRTDDDGRFAYDFDTPVGIYSFEMEGPWVVVRQGDAVSEAKGNVVCVRLDQGSTELIVVVIDRAVADLRPSITGPDVVVVARPHTNPARPTLTLGVSAGFAGSGTLTRSSDRIRVFDAAAGGNELAFDGTDNVFTPAQLLAGHRLFLAASGPSASVGDLSLDLALTVGGTPGTVDTHALTAVSLTLDVGLSRVAPGTDPPLLDEGSKANPGRALQVADPGFSSERALVLVRPPQPADFTGTLSLAALSGLVTLWSDEIPAAGQVPLATPLTIDPATIPVDGLRFFADARSPSAAARDAGFQLGVAGVEADGDQFRSTGVQLDVSRQDTAAAPPVTLVRFGLWDQAYDGAGNVRNGATEATNFVGSDARRFHFRILDRSNTTGAATLAWKTLKADRTDDDAPPSLDLSLPETAAASATFISRGVMLVADATDRGQPTNSGLAAPHPDAGNRTRGQSNHRLRQATIDGFIRSQYSPQAGVRLQLVLPVFQRNPDERRRLPVRVIRYTSAADARYRPATDAYIASQVGRANDRWRQVGLLIAPGATEDRAIPAAAIDAATGLYAGSINNPEEQAVLADLIPVLADDTLTLVFVHLTGGANAYTTIGARNPVPIPAGGARTLDDRFVIFISTNLDLNDETLGHEMHHALFNRFDDVTDRQFIAFNTTAPVGDGRNAGIALPDPRVYRRIQNLNSADPDADPTNDNILNWVRRNRTARQPAVAGTGAATATTGNTLVDPF